MPGDPTYIRGVSNCKSKYQHIRKNVKLAVFVTLGVDMY